MSPRFVSKLRGVAVQGAAGGLMASGAAIWHACQHKESTAQGPSYDTHCVCQAVWTPMDVSTSGAPTCASQ